MNESGNTILITGGASGIGKALAVRFLKAKNTVVVCGRDRSSRRFSTKVARATTAEKAELFRQMNPES